MKNSIEKVSALIMSYASWGEQKKGCAETTSSWRSTNEDKIDINEKPYLPLKDTISIITMNVICY